MSEKIYDPKTTKFDFQPLVLLNPTSISSGYMLKISMSGEGPLYVQSPKCHSKNGIKTSGKKVYTDLVFSHEQEYWIQWIEDLEKHCQMLVFKNQEKWFENTMTMDDIENSFISVLKAYNLGKNYIMKTFVPTRLGKCSLSIFDESENVIAPESITDSHSLITILEFQGVRCSSKNFYMDIELKQMLVLRPQLSFDKCIIQKNISAQPVDDIQAPLAAKDIDSAPSLATARSGEVSSISFTTNGSEQMSEVPMELIRDDKMDDVVEMVVPSEVLTSPFTEQQWALSEVDINLDELKPEDSIQLKNRNQVYYEIYKDAMIKARSARNLAIASYLEAKRIKNLYMLDDLNDEEKDMEFFEQAAEKMSLLEDGTEES